MPFDNLREMLSHTSPSFRCCCSGDRTEQLGFTAGLRHILGQPATPMALAQIDSQLGDASMAIRDLSLALWQRWYAGVSLVAL